MPPSGSDSKYFATQKKGEVHELRNDLNSNSRDKIKEAVKKVIASMTVGKDVSSLFTDVIKCMHTPDIELKKLIYLYIINYARSQPEKAILVVAAFQRDSADKNPLIRALAIRTMGCIRVDRITQFLCDPLQACLNDPDPYVRKTAAICVAKLYDLNPELVEEQGFLSSLTHMLTDNNHTVVANAVASLMEISQLSGRTDLIQWTTDLLSNLLVALNACTEWGQISILECLSTYIPTSSQQAEDVIERVTPRLKHANAAVAMAAIKLILAYLPFITNEDVKLVLLKQKLPPPLITLLGDRRAEIQYVALRHVELIIQKYPTILTSHVKHFFCKYSDTSYVKVEKIDILVRLITPENMEKVLLEFKEYACEADVDFVRKAIRAIGRCAIKLPACSQNAVAILLSLIENRVNYVVQESILVIKNIFRRYPEQYESIITTLCQHLDSLDDNDAKNAMIWIIGEYCHRIDNSHELLSLWCETFLDEQPNIQLSLLTSTVKLFLKQPDVGQDLVTTVLTLATKQVDSPDVRDRALIYWRLLSTDADLAIKIVFGEKPTIRDDTTEVDADVLDQLLTVDFSTLACVYQKPSSTFVKDINKQLLQQQQEEYYYEDDTQQTHQDEYANQDDDVNYQQQQQQQIPQQQQQQQQQQHQPMQQQQTQQVQQQPAPMEIDLLGLTGLSGASPQPAQQQQQPMQQHQPQSNGGDLLDMFGLVTSTQQQVQQQPQQQIQHDLHIPVLLPPEKGNGITIRGQVIRNPQGTYQQPVALELHVHNGGQQPITALPLKFNTNFLGLGPVGQPKVTLVPGAATQQPIIVPLGFTSTGLESQAKQHNGVVQIAVKLPTAVGYFSVNVPYELLFEANQLLQQGQWLTKFSSLKDPQYLGKTTFNPAPQYNNAPAIVQQLQQFGLQHLSTSPRGQDFHIFCSSRFRGVDCCVDVVLMPDGQISANCRNDDGAISQLCTQGLATILQQ